MLFVSMQFEPNTANSHAILHPRLVFRCFSSSLCLHTWGVPHSIKICGCWHLLWYGQVRSHPHPKHCSSSHEVFGVKLGVGVRGSIIVVSHCLYAAATWNQRKRASWQQNTNKMNSQNARRKISIQTYYLWTTKCTKSNLITYIYIYKKNSTMHIFHSCLNCH